MDMWSNEEFFAPEESGAALSKSNMDKVCIN